VCHHCVYQRVVRQRRVVQTQLRIGGSLFAQQIPRRDAGAVDQLNEQRARGRGLQILDDVRLDPRIADQAEGVAGRAALGVVINDDINGHEGVLSATGSEFGDERRAQLCVAGAAILDEEQHKSTQAIKIGAIDDRAAMPLGSHQAGARQNAEVSRHCVLRHVELARDFARSHAIGLMPHQQAKDVEACALSKRT
jgi:hypothetical protein